MNWQRIAQHEWIEPLEMASSVAHLPNMVLLYSGRQERFSGHYSFLFFDSDETICGSSFHELPAIPEGTQEETLPYWVGYLGYGMRLSAGYYTPQFPSFIELPDFCLSSYRRMVRFHHAQKTVEEFSRGDTIAYSWQIPKVSVSPYCVQEIQSNMSREQYEITIRRTLEQIAKGNFYQANITRKFFGRFNTAPNSWDIFQTLCAQSPAPYSAYIKRENTAILSSSPECFLTVKADRTMIARPIKGSAKRGATPMDDITLQNELAASEKNIAENLMIVDLMRNDLARVSEPASVSVSERAALYSYATIHHLVSTISARRKENISVYDAVQAAFPPGSMTGAPKISAIRWCDAVETRERGVYSGVIGWFGAKNTCDLSVVIRTLMIQDDRFEFQVGGGIVADSTPDGEWKETLVKAQAIARTLGITEETLAAL